MFDRVGNFKIGDTVLFTDDSSRIGYNHIINFKGKIVKIEKHRTLSKFPEEYSIYYIKYICQHNLFGVRLNREYVSPIFYNSSIKNVISYKGKAKINHVKME
jgi:hypothetical protein